MADSHTALIMDNMELYGGKPSYGLEVADNRPIPDQDILHNIIDNFVEDIESTAMDTVLEDEVEAIVSSWTTSLHYIMLRLERKHDKAATDIKLMTDSYDGSEIQDHQLQQQQNLATSINNKREVLEDMRDRMGALMEVRFGTVWHPPKGNHVSHQNKLTSAVVDARSYLHAKKQEKLTALMPAGTKIAFAGGKQFDNLDKIWKILDKAKARYPDMVLVHGDSPGAEHIAKKWAEASGVSQIRCTPEWKVYEKAAPFRRNDEMLKLDLIALIATPGSGVTENLVDKAKAKNVKVVRIS